MTGEPPADPDGPGGSGLPRAPEQRPWRAGDWTAWVAALLTFAAPVACFAVVLRTLAGPGHEWAVAIWVVLTLLGLVLLVPTVALVVGFGVPRPAAPGRPVPRAYRALAWALLGSEVAVALASFPPTAVRLTLEGGPTLQVIAVTGGLVCAALVASIPIVVRVVRSQAARPAPGTVSRAARPTRP